jgi:hypothetical protein
MHWYIKRKECNHQPSLLNPVNLFFIIEGEIKIFQNKQNLKEFMASEPALWKIFKGIHYPEEKYKTTRKIIDQAK